MARGWESKAVEEQISAAETTKPARTAKLTAPEIERRKKKEGLLVERRRLVLEMERGHKRRYLELLERSLAHIDAELAKLEES